ncbi:hypothetical protein [Naasia sp. SYSU D00948]|uniref:hypothetical protein n=1 Tax=Naasia sp. SYSU D00948 TaxID=2817379 RepID=UPI001B30729E|nr:hypothetical protein [Naasia sp. SYSU D00948]
MLPHIRWSGELDLVPIEATWLSPKLVQERVSTDPRPSLFVIEDLELVLTPHPPEADELVTDVAMLPAESRAIRLNSWRDLEPIRGSHVADSLSSYAADTLERALLNSSSTFATSRPEQDCFDVYAGEGHGRRILQVEGAGEGVDVGLQQYLGRDVLGQALLDGLRTVTNRANLYRHGHGMGAGGQSGEARTVGNVNMRRDLTYRFTSQARLYDVEVALRGVRLGFSNGRLGSWRQGPLTAMQSFLDSVLTQGQREAAHRLVGLASGAASSAGAVQHTIEGLEGDRGGFGVTALQPQENPALYDVQSGKQRAYRWRPGYRQVLSTDSFRLIADYTNVRPLLGQVDALDQYARGLQDVDLDDRTSLVDQRKLLTDALGDISDPEQRSAAYAGALRPDNVMRLSVDRS